MSLKEQLNQNLIAAMKAKEEVKLRALRMVKAAVMNFEVAGKEKIEARDEDVLAIIKKEVKKREDSIQQFEQGGRADLAASEREEMEILKTYLPEMMGEDQLREIVKAGGGEVRASGPSDMGKVMGAVMGKVKGQADGAVVRKVVQEVLT